MLFHKSAHDVEIGFKRAGRIIAHTISPRVGHEISLEHVWVEPGVHAATDEAGETRCPAMVPKPALFIAAAIVELEALMLSVRFAGVDRDPLDPGFKKGWLFFSVRNKVQRLRTQPLKIWQMPLLDKAIHQHGSELIELKHQHPHVRFLSQWLAD